MTTIITLLVALSAPYASAAIQAPFDPHPAESRKKCVASFKALGIENPDVACKHDPLTKSSKEYAACIKFHKGIRGSNPINDCYFPKRRERMKSAAFKSCMQVRSDNGDSLAGDTCSDPEMLKIFGTPAYAACMKKAAGNESAMLACENR